MPIYNERGVFNVGLFGWSTGWLTVYEVSLVLGQTHLAQAKGPRYPPHPSTSAASPGTYGHTSLLWCTTNPWIPFTAWQSIGIHLIHRKQCLATLREYPARGATSHPGASPQAHNAPPTHADAPHYPPPPLIQEIRKVGDVFAATFTLSMHTPITSNISISIIIFSSLVILLLESPCPSLPPSVTSDSHTSIKRVHCSPI